MRIGIDARGMNVSKTGITTYIEEVLKRIIELDESDNEYILYSNTEIKIDLKESGRVTLKNYNTKGSLKWFLFELPKVLKEDKIDIFWGTQHLLPIKNRYTKDIKYILTIHDLANLKLKDVGEKRNSIIQKLLVKPSCKKADVIIAVSQSTKKDIIEIFKINKDKIHVIYEGTNFNNEYNISEKEEKDILKKFDVVNKNYLFFVSTIEPRKNIITLIKAFEILKEKTENNKLKLVLAGGLGWKYEPILNAIENSKYKNDIYQVGYVSKEEKECLLHNAKCFVYPSLYEGFGLPILEAMAKEAIVVTSNNSSMPEVGGEAAFYLNDVHNKKELASLIENVLNLNQETKKEIIGKGHNQVKKFTWEKCAKEIIQILKG